jgi:DNA polymerase-3 subunit gamma/tau
VWPLLERLADGDGKAAIAESDRIAARSISFDAALEELAAILHRIALAQAGAAPDPDDPDAPRISAMASRLDAARVQVMYQVALLGRRDLPLAPDEYAGFTMALLRMVSFADPSGAPRLTRPMGEPRRPEPTGAAPSPPARAAPAAPRESSAPVAREAAPPTREAIPAAATAKPGVRFEGDWSAFVRDLGLTGMAGMVARHGEVVSFGDNHLQLVVPEAQKMYMEKTYVDKLKGEIAPYFPAGFRLTVRAGTTSGASVAAAASRDEEKRRADAAGAIEEDPFVREIVRDLGAEVVPSSIRPAPDATAGKPSEKR